MHAYSYLKSSTQILEEYKGEEPFSSFLKKYFGQNKKFGSKDRKWIGHLCYCYLRLGKALPDMSIGERVLTGLFLCSEKPNEMLEQLNTEWNKKTSLSLREKLLVVNYSFLISQVFPFKEQMSNGIDHEKFCESFFIQPDFFLRLRPGYEDTVKRKLLDHGIDFSEISASCLSLPNASKIENIIELDKEAVVQDRSSQETGNLLKNIKYQISNQKAKLWDCCAGSGGKSLMLYDIDPNIELTVSDIRPSILSNLKKRFARAGVRNYKSLVTDLTQPHFSEGVSNGIISDLSDKSQNSNFELIICDAPCTGSGTWSRTPEQLYFFDEKKIEQYVLLQKKIVSNIIPQLKEGGHLLYITCSVFKKENEEVVNFIKDNSGLRLIKMDLLRGYDKKADTMFGAVIKKEFTA